MRITFWGAAGEVTGSMHELSSRGRRYLLDCGLNQGRRKDADSRNRNLPFRAASIDAVVLSHAHIDHSGNLPTLVKSGFEGRIHATPPTVDLCGAMLRDTAYIQEKDAEFVNKRRRRRGNGETVEPLYVTGDAERAIARFHGVPYHSRFDLDAGLSYEPFDAGHMLGSSFVLLEQRANAKPLRLVFSGDIGRPGLPILRDPEPMPPADYLIMESTYGDRLHKVRELAIDKLAATIARTCARGGKIIAPAFAVGRTQQLVLLLHELANGNRIPHIPIFVDSPLAVNVTQIFRDHTECFDEEAAGYLKRGEDPFGFSRLQYVREAAESRKLNDLHGPCLILSASGMCEAGRILHHLRNNIENPRNTVLITGFQAENTLGRKLVDRLPEVNIFGEPMRLRAEVVTLSELSGHADQGELLAWMKPAAQGLKKVFLVHGEPAQSAALAAEIERTYHVETVVAARGQSFELQ
jgi:metallo-beta-lactamase family protein